MTDGSTPRSPSALIGLRSKPFHFVVERGKIREFAAATLVDDPAYVEDPEPVVPPTFLASAAHWAPYELELLEATGWDRRRMLHAAQEYVFPGPPPRAGARLHGAAVVEDAYEKQGRRGGTLRFLVLATEFLDEQDRLVARARTTVVETSQAPGKA